MKTNQEIVEEFKSLFGWIANKTLYNGEKVIPIMIEFIESHLNQKDREWRERMVEVLESVPHPDGGNSLNLVLNIANWQQEQINKLKGHKVPPDRPAFLVDDKFKEAAKVVAKIFEEEERAQNAD